MMGRKVGDKVYSPEWNSECLNCLCQVCTGRRCPYQHDNLYGYRFRCAKCVRGDFVHRICAMCDFFENRNRVQRRYKIKIRHKREDITQKKLNAIMKKLGIEEQDGKK